MNWDGVVSGAVIGDTIQCGRALCICMGVQQRAPQLGEISLSNELERGGGFEASLPRNLSDRFLMSEYQKVLVFSM